MSDNDLAALALWLEQTQGIAIAPDPLRDAAAVAARCGALAGSAARALPFEAEPSGYDLAVARLRRTRGGDAG